MSFVESTTMVMVVLLPGTEVDIGTLWPDTRVLEPRREFVIVKGATTLAVTTFWP